MSIGKSKKSAYENAEVISEVYKAVIACPVCKQKLRIPVFQNKKLRISCSKCEKSFTFDCGRYWAKQKLKIRGIAAACFILIFVNIAIPIYLLLSADSSKNKIKTAYEDKMKKMRNGFSMETKKLEEGYNNEVAKIDAEALRKAANEHYENIYKERQNFTSKYAITPREKAQLEMSALANDKTKNIEDIIRVIATKSAPRNSSISVYASGEGYNLDIDFDMSVLSSGEEGITTKHKTVDSLKRETIRLVSKALNDVYQFCQSLDLASIAIGCRHYVNQYEVGYENAKSKENIIIYRVRLDNKDLKELKSNPFLDTYSTTNYFKVEQDEFPNLKISLIDPYEK